MMSRNQNMIISAFVVVTDQDMKVIGTFFKNVVSLEEYYFVFYRAFQFSLFYETFSGTFCASATKSQLKTVLERGNGDYV